MSSISRHTTRRLSRCYWRFELRAHRALCLESRVLSGARDDVGSLDSLAGGCAGVRFDSRVDAKTSHGITYTPGTAIAHPVNYGTYYARLRIRIHWQFPGVKNMDTHTSAVAEHACSAGTTHFLRFDKVSVLAREKYFVPRKVREAIEISRLPNFNRDGGWALPPGWKPTYNVAGLECDTVSAVCNTVFASTRVSNPTPTQPPANESNEPTSSSRPPDSTRDSRQRARWARSSNRQ
ncbi:hypothetical protein SFRURICE_013529 [Spodoptera frugiperda]|nr:hypothetical protein SFRURICE_013529 [Spodoptera frugiperda]